jgi:hypothetical protein
VCKYYQTLRWRCTIQVNLPKIRLCNSIIYNQVKGPFKKEMFTDDVVSNHGLEVMPTGLFADSFQKGNKDGVPSLDNMT